MTLRVGMSGEVAPRGRSWLPWAGVLLVLLMQGCATKRYVGPTSGRSADLQRAVSASLDNIVRGFSFAPYAGRSCFLEVVSLAENSGGTSPENESIGALFAERLAMDGVRTVPDPGKADLHMIVRARTVGVNVVRRDLPPPVLPGVDTRSRGSSHDAGLRPGRENRGAAGCSTEIHSCADLLALHHRPLRIDEVGIREAAWPSASDGSWGFSLSRPAPR